MSQSNPKIQQSDGEFSQSLKQQAEAAGVGNVTSNVPTHKFGKQKNRSPEQQAEVERIGKLEPYVGLQRDEDLFTCLNHWCDLKICVRLTTIDRLSLSKALDYYTKQRVNRRGDLLQVPAPVASIEMEQHGSATDLFLKILEFLSNPLDCGPLRDLRSRTWGTLKGYGVKILIVNNADLLSFAAFNELVRIAEKLKISVILAGPPYLNDLIDPNSSKKKKYINIHNTFLKFYPFDSISLSDTATVVDGWERAGLRWLSSLNLAADPSIVKHLHESSHGQLRILYEILREIAVWRIDHPKAQVNAQNIVAILGNHYSPISKMRHG